MKKSYTGLEVIFIDTNLKDMKGDPFMLDMTKRLLVVVQKIQLHIIDVNFYPRRRKLLRTSVSLLEQVVDSLIG